MVDPTQYFARIASRVNLLLLKTKLAVMVGTGTVGSQVARGLARSGVGRLTLIDGDNIEAENLPRHVVPPEYIGMNKAIATAGWLKTEVPPLQDIACLPRDIDATMADDDLDRLLTEADIIVSATDDLTVQRRIARRALALDIPAIFPLLYETGGGEVFVQARPGMACFLCWDGFRPTHATVRAASALDADLLGVVQLAIQLCIGVLDPRSDFHRLHAGSSTDPRRRNLFTLEPFTNLGYMTPALVSPAPNCPSCAVGPTHQTMPGGTAPSTTNPRENATPTTDNNQLFWALATVVGLILFVVSRDVRDLMLIAFVVWLVGLAFRWWLDQM